MSDRKPSRKERQAAMYRRITAHGRDLLAIYPKAQQKDPVKLCRMLRKIEAEASRHAERLCNDSNYVNFKRGEIYPHEQYEADIMAKVRALLGDGPAVFFNHDPRGYALKIDSEDVQRLGLKIHRDWGGYGIIAPDLTN